MLSLTKNEKKNIHVRLKTFISHEACIKSRHFHIKHLFFSGEYPPQTPIQYGGPPHTPTLIASACTPLGSWSTWSSLVSWYLPVQCLLWYALVVHTEDKSKPTKSFLYQYVVYSPRMAATVSCTVLVLISTLVILSFHKMPYVMCSIQTFH